MMRRCPSKQALAKEDTTPLLHRGDDDDFDVPKNNYQHCSYFDILFTLHMHS